MSDPAYRREELLIAVIAQLLEPCRSVAVGSASPITGAAALLAQAQSGGRLRVSLLGSHRHNPFTNGGVELFDCAAQGRIDAFFLGGGQIDGAANLNLVGIGAYPRLSVRWPGSFGSAHLYHLIPRVILFREEHTRRVLVPRVDFISAAGPSSNDVNRRGGPYALVTGRCLFLFDRARRRFRLASVHPGHDAGEIAEHTGFAFDRPPEVPVTPVPDSRTVAVLRERVAVGIAEVYPRFAETVFGGARTAA